MAFCAAMGVPGTPPPFTADLIMDWMSDYCKEGYTERSLAGRLSSLRRIEDGRHPYRAQMRLSGTALLRLKVPVPIPAGQRRS